MKKSFSEICAETRMQALEATRRSMLRKKGVNIVMTTSEKIIKIIGISMFVIFGSLFLVKLSILIAKCIDKIPFVSDFMKFVLGD